MGSERLGIPTHLSDWVTNKKMNVQTKKMDMHVLNGRTIGERREELAEANKLDLA
jgi:hypothetical protein